MPLWGVDTGQWTGGDWQPGVAGGGWWVAGGGQWAAGTWALVLWDANLSKRALCLVYYHVKQCCMVMYIGAGCMW